VSEEPLAPQPPETDWQQLDPRMLFIDPFRTVRRLAIPGLIALVGVGASDAGLSLRMVPVMLLAAVVLGALPWLTTRYRVTPTQLQVRTGLLQRRVTTAPLDRVRSVDLESSVLHRMLGLTRVTLGTGVDERRIELDALDVARARELRSLLLARSTAPRTPGEEAADAAGGTGLDGTGLDGTGLHGTGLHGTELHAAGTQLAGISWSWLRFAPFNLTRLVVVAGAVGVLAQFGDDAGFFTPERIDRAWDWLTARNVPLAVAIGAVAALLGWIVVAVLGYVLQWWGFRLWRDDTELRMSAGLLSTRSTTVELARVRGVTLTEPLPMRLVGGAELEALATGVGQGGVATVLPPSPVGVAREVGHRLLGTDEPLATALVEHGRPARRRCHVRALYRTAAVVAALAVAVAAAGLRPWLAVLTGVLVALANAAAGEAAYRNLGHALCPQHLVVGHPRVARTRTVLETDGVIGWVLRQSWWQRRLGLTTLVATTAAGAEAVSIVDVPTPLAVALADAATPGMLTPFLRN